MAIAVLYSNVTSSSYRFRDNEPFRKPDMLISVHCIGWSQLPIHALPIFNRFQVIRVLHIECVFPITVTIFWRFLSPKTIRQKWDFRKILQRGHFLTLECVFELMRVNIGLRVIKRKKQQWQKQCHRIRLNIITAWSSYRGSDPNRNWRSWWISKHDPCKIGSQSFYYCNFGEGLKFPILWLRLTPLIRHRPPNPAGLPLVISKNWRIFYLSARGASFWYLNTS